MKATAENQLESVLFCRFFFGNYDFCHVISVQKLLDSIFGKNIEKHIGEYLFILVMIKFDKLFILE